MTQPLIKRWEKLAAHFESDYGEELPYLDHEAKQEDLRVQIQDLEAAVWEEIRTTIRCQVNSPTDNPEWERDPDVMEDEVEKSIYEELNRLRDLSDELWEDRWIDWCRIFYGVSCHHQGDQELLEKCESFFESLTNRLVAEFNRERQ